MSRILSAISRVLPLLVGGVGLVGFHTVVARAAEASPTAAPSPPPPAAAVPTPAPGGVRSWALDKQKSRFVIQVFKDGAASALAHDHTVHATEFTGEIFADTQSPTSARVAITVQTRSLINDDPIVRQRFGLDPTIPDKDRATVHETMLGPSQLDVEKFPTISFASSAVEKEGDRLVLVGDLTLKGVSRKVRMPISVSVSGDTLTGDGTLRFKQSDWGMTPYSAFLGAVKNKDELILNVHLVARAAG